MASLSPQELLKRALLGRILGWRKKLEKLDATAVSQILKILSAGNQKIRETVKRDLPSLLDTNPRKSQIVLWTREVTKETATDLANTVSDAWATSALNSLQAYNAILSFDGKAKAIMPVPETLDELKKLALGKPFKDRSLKDMIDTVFAGGIGGALAESIDAGRKAGWGYEKIVKKVLSDALPLGQTISRRDAITISRSYVQQASVNAQLATYWNNRDVIKGLKWTAILDNRVCIKCAALDGTAYLWEDQKPGLIAHPRCRCLWLPWVKSFRDIGLDMDDLECAARPFVIREDGNVDTGGRKIIKAGTSEENFGAWWKTLPYDQQIKSIGPARTKLVNEGKIAFGDLVDKKTGKVFTLKDMGFSNSGKTISLPAELTVAALEKMPFAIASKVIVENFKKKFPEWSKNPRENLPIAVIPENDAKLIGAKAKVAVISPETYAKQKDHHSELTIDDYLKAQEAVEKGEKIIQDARNMACVSDKPEGVVVIIKATIGGEELYMTSLRRMSRKEEKRKIEIERLKKG